MYHIIPCTCCARRILNVPSVPFPRPQPYKTLKEADIAEAEKGMGHTAPPSPVASQRITEINLLGDIFSSLDVDSEKQPLSQAKSLEDLRTPKEEGPQQVKFGYQVGESVSMDPLPRSLLL